MWTLLLRCGLFVLLEAPSTYPFRLQTLEPQHLKAARQLHQRRLIERLFITNLIQASNTPLRRSKRLHAAPYTSSRHKPAGELKRLGYRDIDTRSDKLPTSMEGNMTTRAPTQVTLEYAALSRLLRVRRRNALWKHESLTEWLDGIL